MENIIKKVNDLDLKGLEPCLLVCGKNVMDEIKKIRNYLNLPMTGHEKEYIKLINVNGHKLRVVVSTDVEDDNFCEVYAK